MRLRPIVFIITTVLVLPGILAAEPVSYGPSGDPSVREVIPPYLVSYTSKDLRVVPGEEPVLRLEGTPVQHMLASGAQSEFKSTYLPVLFSLLIPGLGETYMGYWKRGVALMGVEVIAWTGFAYYNNQGKETRKEFEQFVDANWNRDKWIRDHNASEQINPGNRQTDTVTFTVLDSFGSCCWAGFPAYHTYASREEEWVNYYENVGKYDWFISGWEDWSDPNQRDTDLRTEYRALRGKSNDELDKADRFIFLSLAARAFSLIETLILVRRDNAVAEDKRSGSGFRFSARSTGFSSGQVALVYSFK